MRHYLLSVCQPNEGTRPEPAALERIMRDVRAVHDDLRATGGWVFSGGLHAPETATTLRPKGDDVLTVDGPFTEGKEYIGGLCILRAPDLDAALAWGRRYARATTLPIEVRPFDDVPE